MLINTLEYKKYDVKFDIKMYPNIKLKILNKTIWMWITELFFMRHQAKLFEKNCEDLMYCFKLILLGNQMNEFCTAESNIRCFNNQYEKTLHIIASL